VLGSTVSASAELTGGDIGQAHSVGGATVSASVTQTGGTVGQSQGIGGTSVGVVTTITGGTYTQANNIGGATVASLVTISGGVYTSGIIRFAMPGDRQGGRLTSITRDGELSGYRQRGGNLVRAS